MLQVVFNANSGSSSVNTNRFNPLNRILERCENIRPSGDGYRADCPNGHRSKSTLSVSEGDYGTLASFKLGQRRLINREALDEFRLSLEQKHTAESRGDRP